VQIDILPRVTGVILSPSLYGVLLEFYQSTFSWPTFYRLDILANTFAALIAGGVWSIRGCLV